MTNELLTSIPAWGIFAIAVLWVVFQFLHKMEELRAKRRRSSKPPPPPLLSQIEREDTGRHITADQVAAVVRDQQERREILEALRQQQATNVEIRSCLRTLSTGFDHLSQSESRQTQILEGLAQDFTEIHEILITPRQ